MSVSVGVLPVGCSVLPGHHRGERDTVGHLHRVGDRGQLWLSDVVSVADSGGRGVVVSYGACAPDWLVGTFVMTFCVNWRMYQ